MSWMNNLSFFQQINLYEWGNKLILNSSSSSAFRIKHLVIIIKETNSHH